MAAVAGLFLVLAVAMTWPLSAHLSTQAPRHQDVFFNLWRLRWIAHALAASPRHLFDGNIFYPETGTLALSDAVLLEGFAAAPLLWLHVNSVAVQNVMIPAPIALSGAAMFLLARHLTGSRGGALLAGIVFAFAPAIHDAAPTTSRFRHCRARRIRGRNVHRRAVRNPLSDGTGASTSLSSIDHSDELARRGVGWRSTCTIGRCEPNQPGQLPLLPHLGIRAVPFRRTRRSAVFLGLPSRRHGRQYQQDEHRRSGPRHPPPRSRVSPR